MNVKKQNEKVIPTYREIFEFLTVMMAYPYTCTLYAPVDKAVVSRPKGSEYGFSWNNTESEADSGIVYASTLLKVMGKAINLRNTQITVKKMLEDATR